MELPSRELLERLYLKENKQRGDIAKIFNKSIVTIGRWLYHYSIKKPLKDVRKSITFKNDIIAQKPSKEILVSLYIKQNKSIKELGRYFNKPEGTIRSWLQRENIRKYFILPSKEQVQEYVATNGLDRKGFCNHFKVGKNWYYKLIKRYHLNKKVDQIYNKKDLHHYYIEKNLNRGQIADLYGVSSSTISSYLRKYNIKKPNLLVLKNIEDSYFQKHGVKFSTQRNMPIESVKILNDKSALEKCINSLYSKTYAALGKMLKVSEATVAVYVKNYKLDYLIEKYTSSLEQEIKDLLKSTRLARDRQILEGKEIDLYSEEHKIGIEFNGNYWHSDKFRGKNYHFNKSKLAKSKGVFLYHIFEYEWLDKRTKNIIIDQLKDLFNYDKEVIKVEDCTIKEVPTKDKNTFLNNNHLLNKCESTVNLGLYYKDKLVSIMVFIRVKDQDSLYELSRFCCKIGYRVINGFNCLFDYFIKQYKPKSIITYSDIAKEDEKILGSIGFKLKSIEKPQYCWTDGDNTLTQGQDSLKYIKKKGWLKEDMSMDKVMKDHKFNRLYDCGRKKWLWSI